MPIVPPGPISVFRDPECLPRFFPRPGPGKLVVGDCTDVVDTALHTELVHTPETVANYQGTAVILSPLV